MAKDSNVNKETVKNQEPREEKKTSARFFRAEKSGLKIVVDEQVKAEFVPYFEKFQGDTIRVGYLETSDPAVIERLENDSTVEQIEKKDFEKATGEKSFKAPNLSV